MGNAPGQRAMPRDKWAMPGDKRAMPQKMPGDKWPWAKSAMPWDKWAMPQDSRN